MRKVIRNLSDVGEDFCLSPENWLSAETSNSLADGRPFKEVASLISQQTVPPVDARYVLDTGNARDGFLEIPVLGDPVSGRTSAKKVAHDGDVIISRLRPYLRQVALLPSGVCEMLQEKHIYCSTEFFVFRPKIKEHGPGLVAWLLSEPIQKMIAEAATGGHHPRINPEILLDSPVPDSFLDPNYCSRIAAVLTSHLKGQRELLILLRH